MKGSNNKAIIFAHGDVDGMVCAAQLIRKEKSNCELFFSNAKYIASSLNHILKAQKKPTLIYIADIPADSKAVEKVEKLAESGVDVYWIDHHPWSGENLISRLNNVCKEVVYNESLSTPAGALLGRWLKEEDPYYDKIGQLCYAFDKGTEWERNWFRLLATYIGKSDRQVLERLAYNRNFIEDDLNRIEQQKQDEEKAEEILNKKPQTMETKSNKNMAIYDTSTSKGIYLGHKVFKHHDVDYCLIRISKTKWQLACNPSKKYSMKHLMGKQDIEDHTFSLAGRKNELLAIEKQSGKNLQTDLHGLLINWLCENL